MSKIENPRFPHTVCIYRTENSGTNALPVQERKLILESECRNYANTGSSKYRTRSGVAYSDFTLALPRENVKDIAVLVGDEVEVSGYITGVVLKGKTTAPAQVNNLGANIWYNQIAN